MMLTYFLGDLLRILSGNFKAGEMGGKKVPQEMWLVIAALMVVPIAMVFLTLVLPYETNRWANILAAVFFFGFNVLGLPSYPSAQDRLLIVVGLAFNALTIWYAWQWVM
jgi:hypothetical protein